MASHGGVKAFWSLACSTTSPENIIRLGGWRIGPADDDPNASGASDSPGASNSYGASDSPGASCDAIAVTWFAEGGTDLGTHRYTPDHVVAHGLEGAPTFVLRTDDPEAEDSPFRWLIAIAPMPSRAAFHDGAPLSHLHFQYAHDLGTLLAKDASTGAEILRNPRWYATMCADEGDADDRARIVRALHHLEA